MRRGELWGLGMEGERIKLMAGEETELEKTIKLMAGEEGSCEVSELGKIESSCWLEKR